MTLVRSGSARTAGGRATTGDRFADETGSRVLVALPQSGRSTWLAHQIELAQQAAAAPAPALWLGGDPDGPVPARVEVLDLPGLLAIAPADLAGRIVAVDDLHLLEPADLDQLAGHLGLGLANGATLLATSITVPPPPFSEWGRGHLIRWVGQDALRLDSSAFARALVPLGLRAQQARHLQRTVDGWAGPLAVANRGAGRAAGELNADTLAGLAVERADRTLAPLLAPFDPLPAGLSLLPSIGRTLLAEAFGTDDDEALRTLRHFSAPAGAADGPMRPHWVLRRILERVAPPGPDASAVRDRALAWYLAHDHYADAVQLLIEAHRPAEAITVIREHQLDLLYYDGHAKQKQLMDALPRFGWTEEDYLMYTVACLAAGDHRAAGFALNSAVLAAPDLPEPLSIARNNAIAYLGMLAYPPELCIEAAERSLRALDELPEDTPVPHLLIADSPRLYRTVALLHIARNKIVLGAWDEALEALDEAGMSGHPLLDNASNGFRSWLLGLRGDSDEARRGVTRAMAATEFWPELQVLAVEPRLALAEVHLLAGRADAAWDLGTQALSGATTRSSEHQMACALVVIAEAELRSGRPAHARASLERIRDGAYGFVGQRADAIRARILLEAGDEAGASTILRRLPLNQHTIVAHAHGAARGPSPLAREEIDGWQPPPWPSGQQARREARTALDARPATGTQALTTIGFALPDPHRFAAVADVAAAHGLSQREEEILFAVLADASLSDVADHLFISRNTLKTHLRRIYRKLAVHARQEAIALVERTEAQRP